ncbi:ribonuclease HI family protein [Fervidicoccus fontis]|uniref:Ribonuclease H n=2 Tax=Fervidicoccus fontis TaxID=683846 RepID=H9ZZV0_FERFK|nr:ribonuclease HI [Fervidicoccus fontis]AFH42257.1 ribonuclease H [Fervidicoccus fontis Kam940]MBE9391009.1 ribonuclease HI family protein [Fervidicoccus fontis]
MRCSKITIKVFFDGLYVKKDEEGIGTYAFVIYRNKEKIYEEMGKVSRKEGRVTNNAAEYIALEKALRWIIERGLNDEKVIILGDSQLVIRQLNGEYKIKSENLYPLFLQIKNLLNKFKDVEISWIPREENQEADFLTKKALSLK